jgi:general secretion pathway protein I
VRRAQRGFTLIEVIAAFVVLCLVLSVGFEIFSTGMSRAGDLDDRSRALAVAQSQLAAAGADGDLKQGQEQGETRDRRFHWTTAITPTDEGLDAKNPPNTVYQLFRVDVTVEWRTAAGRPQQMALSTLTLGQRPQ